MLNYEITAFHPWKGDKYIQALIDMHFSIHIITSHPNNISNKYPPPSHYQYNPQTHYFKPAVNFTPKGVGTPGTTISSVALRIPQGPLSDVICLGFYLWPPTLPMCYTYYWYMYPLYWVPLNSWCPEAWVKQSPPDIFWGIILSIPMEKPMSSPSRLANIYAVIKHVSSL